MANLSVRKLDPKVYKRLRLRAAKHGISMEEEVRRILYQAVAVPEKFSEAFTKHFGMKNGIELDIPNQGEPHHPMEFQE